MLRIYKEDFQEQSSRLLNKIDPYNKQFITFSDTISLFSSEFTVEQDEKGNNKNISILNRVSADNEILQSLSNK